MQIDYVLLLQTQREIQERPRGTARFRHYVRTILNEDQTGTALAPLVLANPMARDHVTRLLDDLLALDADGVAARAAADAASRLADVSGDFRASLVVIDDAKGGWTNRYAVEFGLRFGGPRSPGRTGPTEDRPWITGALWSSEPAGERTLREAIATAVHRTAYVLRHGRARTLRQMLDQEGAIMALAGCTAPSLDWDDLDYTRAVLAPMLETSADDMPTAVACLFGDAAARSLGFTPFGLSPWAGLALALHDARCRMPARSVRE